MKKVLFLALFLCCFYIQSQSSFTFGWLPKVNVSSKLSDNIKWVNSLEAREQIFKQNIQFTHKLVDVTSTFSMKLNANQSFNLGYVARFSGRKTVHRLLQHYNFIEQFDNFKLANRLGFEQFFSSKNKLEYRVRYRVTFQKALNGERIDVKEFYVKVANEYLYQFNKEDLEIRIAPYIGYKLSKKDKVEFGFDYRSGKLLNSNRKNSLWFRTTWYISL